MCSLASRYMQRRTQSFAQESEPPEEFSTSPMSPASSAGISSLVRRSLTSITSILRRMESSISPWRAYEREVMSNSKGNPSPLDDPGRLPKPPQPGLPKLPDPKKK